MYYLLGVPDGFARAIFERQEYEHIFLKISYSITKLYAHLSDEFRMKIERIHKI